VVEAMQNEAAERCESRKIEEARRAVGILKQLDILDKKDSRPDK
jgi:hypothetical protein